MKMRTGEQRPRGSIEKKRLIYYSVRSAHKSGRLSKLSKRVFLLPELKIDVNFGNAKWALFRGSSLLVST